MSRSQTLIALSLVVLLAAAGLAWYFLGQPAADLRTEAPAMAGAADPITAYDRTLGDPKAPVTLIEYAAPRCPHCAAFNAEIVPQIKANYIDTGKVRYVLRVFPLSADDGAAEKLARCLPQEQYFAFMDTLFKNQSKWDDMYGITDVRGGLIQMARLVGMAPEQAGRCIDDTAGDAAINKVAADGQARYAIAGTPTVIVDGAVIQPPGYDEIAHAIDAALAKKP